MGFTVCLPTYRTWVLPPSPAPPRRKQPTGRPGHVSLFPGVNSPSQSRSWSFLPRCFLTRLPSRPDAVSGLVVPPLCFLSTLGPDAACLDDSHCHSISTTRLSSRQRGGQVSANLLVQVRARRPIAAVVRCEWQPMRPIGTLAHHYPVASDQWGAYSVQMESDWTLIWAARRFERMNCGYDKYNQCRYQPSSSLERIQNHIDSKWYLSLMRLIKNNKKDLLKPHLVKKKKR